MNVPKAQKHNSYIKHLKCATNNQSIYICKHYSGNNSEFKIDSENYNLFLDLTLVVFIKH